MMRAARDTLRSDTHVLAVTVLTSLDKDCEEIYSRLPPEQVRILAEMAWQSGANGFVCSPHEVAMLRERYPEALIVVPGVRSEGVEAGDQRRVGTPAKTLGAGANHIVMGRQITQSADPVAEIERVRASLTLSKLIATT